MARAFPPLVPDSVPIFNRRSSSAKTSRMLWKKLTFPWCSPPFFIRHSSFIMSAEARIATLPLLASAGAAARGPGTAGAMKAISSVRGRVVALMDEFYPGARPLPAAPSGAGRVALAAERIAPQSDPAVEGPGRGDQGLRD